MKIRKNRKFQNRNTISKPGPNHGAYERPKGEQVAVSDLNANLPNSSRQTMATSDTRRSVGKVLYRIFVFLMLSLALFYSYEANEGWNSSPVVTSGKIPKIYFKKLCIKL